MVNKSNQIKLLELKSVTIVFTKASFVIPSSHQFAPGEALPCFTFTGWNPEASACRVNVALSISSWAAFRSWKLGFFGHGKWGSHEVYVVHP